MNYIELQEDLQNLIKKDISRSKIAKILNTSRQNINKKFKNPEKSEVTVSDIEKIQSHLGVKIFVRADDKNNYFSSNTLELKDTQFKEHPTLGHRLTQIQEENGFQNKAMAKFMQIDESRYRHIVSGDISPTAQELLNLASKIDVSLDWLIKG